MDNEIKQFERIQDYLCNRMSVEERAIFEKDLLSDENLKKQYEELSLIAFSVKKANQEVDLRLALEEKEKELSSINAINDSETLGNELEQIESELQMMGVSVDHPKKSAFVFIKERLLNAFNRIVQWFSIFEKNDEKSTPFYIPFAGRMVISLAIVASFVLVIILPNQNRTSAVIYKSAPSRLEFQKNRSTSPEYLDNAVIAYNNGDYIGAELFLQQAKKGITETLSKIDFSDSGIHDRQMLIKELNVIEWYLALTYMKEKKVSEAKRLLIIISESKSQYSDSASRILKNVY
jgi:hypothetical protein